MLAAAGIESGTWQYLSKVEAGGNHGGARSLLWRALAGQRDFISSSFGGKEFFLKYTFNSKFIFHDHIYPNVSVTVNYLFDVLD